MVVGSVDYSGIRILGSGSTPPQVLGSEILTKRRSHGSRAVVRPRPAAQHSGRLGRRDHRQSGSGSYLVCDWSAESGAGWAGPLRRRLHAGRPASGAAWIDGLRGSGTVSAGPDTVPAAGAQLMGEAATHSASQENRAARSDSFQLFMFYFLLIREKKNIAKITISVPSLFIFFACFSKV